MGEYAEMYLERELAGHISLRGRGIPMPKQREYPQTTKAAIADRKFHIVEVVGGFTNRPRGMKLVVCDNTEDAYWVWASGSVTGIRKEHCKVLEADLPLNDALARTGRKPYGPKDN